MSAASCGHAAIKLHHVTDEDDAQVAVGADNPCGPGHDGTGVPTHGFQGHAHGLPLLFLGLHNLAVTILSAVGADAMSQHRLAAVRAVLHLDRREMLMTTSLALPSMR